jgi:hypothetical protein
MAALVVPAIVLLIRDRTAGRHGPQSMPFPTISGDPEKLDKEVQELFDFAANLADGAIVWYCTKRRPKRALGWWLRVGVIVATAVAGLIPVFAELFQEADGGWSVRPGWSTVALGFAALFLALDKFGGYTSGWIRFMLAEMELTRARDEFRFDWQNAKLAWTSPRPSKEQAEQSISKAKSFVQQVHSIITEETKVWAAEFQAVLRELDAAAKAGVEVKRPGAINVRVANGEKCGEGWTLAVNGGFERRHSGQSASINDLVPGNHVVRVRGSVDGCEKSAERTVGVASGAIVDVDLTLT